MASSFAYIEGDDTAMLLSSTRLGTTENRRPAWLNRYLRREDFDARINFVFFPEVFMAVS
jgi:hypothetical protein